MGELHGERILRELSADRFSSSTQIHEVRTVIIASMRKGAFMAIALALCVLPVRAGATDEQHILFIGNSLTAANDLPGMVCRLAAAAGHKAACETVSRGGFSLQDHLADGAAARRIRARRWSVIVLQQGPSAREDSRVDLRRSAQKFAALAGESRIALYAPWPWKSRSQDFPRVSDSYRLASKDVEGLFFAAGDAWLAAWRRDPAIRLYGSDDFHPSAAGTYLAALTIYSGIYGHLPAMFGERTVAERAAGAGLEVSDEQLRTLLAAAR
jgi:hypothetical protein